MAKRVKEEIAVEVFWSNTGSNIDMSKLLTFNRNASKVLGFLTLYKLYLRIRIKNTDRSQAEKRLC